MKRELRRIYRNHGIKYFALPVIVLLLIVVFADRVLPGYLEHRAEIIELEAKLDSNATVLALGKKLQKSAGALGVDFDTTHKLILSNADVLKAGLDLQEHVRKILDSLYFDNITLLDVSQRKQGNVNILTTVARFSGVPQQLPRLEAALANSSSLLAVEKLEISVVDDTKRGGQQLWIVAYFSAIQMQPIVLPAPGEDEKKGANQP